MQLVDFVSFCRQIHLSILPSVRQFLRFSCQTQSFIYLSCGKILVWWDEQRLVSVETRKSPHHCCKPHIFTSSVQAESCMRVSSATHSEWNSCSHSGWLKCWKRELNTGCNTVTISYLFVLPGKEMLPNNTETDNLYIFQLKT